jgi:uncharacterized protein YceK
MKRNLLVGAAALALMCSGMGCSSIVTHIPYEKPGPYGGVRLNADLVAHPRADDNSVLERISSGVYAAYGVIDMPFSATLDTLLLPIDKAHRPPAPTPDSAAVEQPLPERFR